MYPNIGFVDFYMRDRVDELRREAEYQRLIDEAIGQRRPIRAQIARRLYAIAQWVEGPPRHAAEATA
jgi:hypothetical protein